MHLCAIFSQNPFIITYIEMLCITQVVLTIAAEVTVHIFVHLGTVLGVMDIILPETRFL